MSNPLPSQDLFMSYNNFIKNGIRKILQDTNPICFKDETTNTECKIYMGPNYWLGIPIVDKLSIEGYDSCDDNCDEDYKNLDDQFWMFPDDARKYKLTYLLDLEIYINIEVHYQNNEGKPIQNQINFALPKWLGGIPLMVFASNCALNKLGLSHIFRFNNDDNMFMFNNDDNDIGGYFIIDGVEKVLPMELPGELMQQHMKEWYIEQIPTVVSRIESLFHNNNYTGENFPNLFKENYDEIFDFQDGLETTFRKLFTSCENIRMPV